MEVIRGRESDCRQEIRSAVERGGTRPTRRVDPQRQAFRPVAGEGPHPAEGRRIGARRRLERQPDCRGAGHQYPHYRADQAPAGRGGVRGGVEAQIQSQFRPAADFRRRSRSKIDRADPLSGPGGFRPLEPAPARGEGRRTAHCRARQRQHDRADAKKNILKPHRRQQWVIPPDASAAFVANMEDVLEVYQRPHDPQRPLVCLDETSKQLIIETRAPIPAKPGRKARHDYEYERNGVANLFMVFAPLEGWRHVKVTDRHAAIDYAHTLRDLSDVHFPDAAKIVLVQDNLNTPTPASLYEAFPAPEARRLVERFEWHYTPKHGSWLDMAESELSVLASQCLNRRIADKQILAHEVNAWQIPNGIQMTQEFGHEHYRLWCADSEFVRSYLRSWSSFYGQIVAPNGQMRRRNLGYQSAI